MSTTANLTDAISPTTWTGPIGPVRLKSVRVDLTACHAEVRAVPDWSPLFMHQAGGRWAVDWRAFSLRGYSDLPLDVYSPATRGHGAAARGEAVAPPTVTLPLVYTTAAAKFPHCLAVADQIPGASERIRINWLGPGGILPKHRDPFHSSRWEDRTIVRFHVPLLVPDGCVFFAWDRRGQCHQVCDPPGSVWFIDTDAPHMAVNASTEPRYHLVVDKFLDPELRGALMASAAHGEAAPR